MTPIPDWRSRLRTVYEQSGRSASHISLEAGLGRNYLREVLVVGKSCTVENLIALAAELDTDLGFLTDDTVQKLRHDKAKRLMKEAKART